MTESTNETELAARRIRVRVLILTGLGLNCEEETEIAHVARHRARHREVCLGQSARWPRNLPDRRDDAVARLVPGDATRRSGPASVRTPRPTAGCGLE